MNDVEEDRDFVTVVAETLYNSIRNSMTIKELKNINFYSYIYDQCHLDSEVLMAALEVLEEEGCGEV